MAVITISREFGAGGKSLGRRIADRLGYYYADEDIIERAVVEIHTSSDRIGVTELKRIGKLQKYIAKLIPFGKSLMEIPLSDEKRYIDGVKYLELLNMIISQIAAEGKAVIVGRGGQFILEHFDNTHHILMVANQKDRIQFMMDHYHYSSNVAAQVVKRMEKRRSNLYGYFGRKDYDNLTHYHLTLNMSMLSMEKAEELVLELVA